MTKLTYLRQCEPETWFRQVSAALISSHGRLPAAAKALGVPESTLKRWVVEDARLGRIRPKVSVGRRPGKASKQALP